MRRCLVCALLVDVCFIAGCGAGRDVEPPLPPQTQVRAIDALPAEIESDIITVRQFRQVCDKLARSLVTQPFITRAPRPPVITIRPLENKTGVDVDESIFQETIRAKLMEHAGGAVLFRDDVSYKDVLQERLRQGNEEVTITATDSTITTRNRDDVRGIELGGGFLSGSNVTQENINNVESESGVQIEHTGSVKARVADADYFLRGLVYQIKERDVNDPQRGMNYYQYQFRIVDARTGLIVWEKMLGSKLEGKYTELKEKDDDDDTSGFGGIADPTQPVNGQGYPIDPRTGQPYPGTYQQYPNGYPNNAYPNGTYQNNQGQRNSNWPPNDKSNTSQGFGGTVTNSSGGVNSGSMNSDSVGKAMKGIGSVLKHAK